VYESGRVDENIRYTGDWMLWAKMLLISDIYLLPNHSTIENMVTLSPSSTNKILLSEYCQIVHYISFNVQVPKPILKEILDKTISWWLGTILHQPNLSLRKKKIYRILSNIDRRLTHRLISRWLLK